MISSPDLVLGGLSSKKRGRGEGKGEEETRSDKIRLRGSQSGPRVKCACPKSDMLSCVQYRHRVRCRVSFLFKKRGSLNLKPKTQALRCFEGCSAAGQHILAVLPTGYRKRLTDLRAVAAKHVGNRNVSVLIGGRAGPITIVVLPLSAAALQISGLNKSEAGPLLFLLQCETRAKEQTKT